jgi:hypothetical protein
MSKISVIVFVICDLQEILLGRPDRGFDGQDIQMVDITRPFATSY